jgi:hypothetical protein
MIRIMSHSWVRRVRLLVVGALATFIVSLAPRPARAAWLMNFGPAPTLPAGRISFTAGVGGQFALVGSPRQVSADALGPHVGLRVGVARFADIGLRVTPLPLPFVAAGPATVGNLDAKFRITPSTSKWQFAAVVGAGVGHLALNDVARFAYAPNAALLFSKQTGGRGQLTVMARYAYLAIPSAQGGSASNHVHIGGGSIGFQYAINTVVAVVPEIGGYWYSGQLLRREVSGPAIQIGAALVAAF